MFIIINILIAMVWLITQQTMMDYAFLHAASLIMTVPLVGVEIIYRGDDHRLLDIAITVLFSACVCLYSF